MFEVSGGGRKVVSNNQEQQQLQRGMQASIRALHLCVKCHSASKDGVAVGYGVWCAGGAPRLKGSVPRKGWATNEKLRLTVALRFGAGDRGSYSLARNG